MILVLGATGPTGRSAVAELLPRGETVRAVTRDPRRADDLTGAEIYVGDSSQPDSLERAFAGVSKLYLVPPTLPGWGDIETDILALARAAGVDHVVRISALGTDPDAASMSLRFHWRGERQLERSGMAFTHIRCNSFFQNTLFDAPWIKRDSAIYSCVGPLRFAKVDARDIGEAVATVLTSPGHESRAYTLTGPESLSYADLADVMSRVLGRPIRSVDMSVADYTELLVRDGVEAWLAEEFAAIYGLGFAEGSEVEEVTDAVSQLLARPPRTFAAFVAENRAQFQ
jgi:uncharacterized protein YbjT (DUF2867 family)